MIIVTFGLTDSLLRGLRYLPEVGNIISYTCMEQTGNCMQFHQGDEKNPTLQEDVLANTPGNHHEY